jgi:hypothetical protein
VRGVQARLGGEGCHVNRPLIAGAASRARPVDNDLPLPQRQRAAPRKLVTPTAEDGRRPLRPAREHPEQGDGRAKRLQRGCGRLIEGRFDRRDPRLL